MMCVALHGRYQHQPLALTYDPLRAMDALAFDELLFESFEHRAYRVIHNHRYIGDGGIDGLALILGWVGLIQAKH